MSSPADKLIRLSRARLCLLGEVDRGKHLRWQQRRLLSQKASYGIADVLQAALLDEINTKLGPKASRAVWGQVRNEIGIPGRRLEVVIVLATHRARLARSDRELAAAISRGEEIMVVDLSARSRLVRDRVDSYRDVEAPASAEEKHAPSAAGHAEA